MIAQSRVKRGSLVGVVTTAGGLGLARRMADPPDFFELRLDRLVHNRAFRRDSLAGLPAPLILTARHPAEGGANRLPVARRRQLLMKFLPHARYIDIELRSVAGMREVLAAARQTGVGIIVSVHDFQTTPTIRSLCTKAKAARQLRADVFKVATRADAPEQLQRLIDFSTMIDMPCAIMAMGKLSLRSRLLFAERGSVFVYGAVARTAFTGQPTLAQLRSALARRRTRIN